MYSNSSQKSNGKSSKKSTKNPKNYALTNYYAKNIFSALPKNSLSVAKNSAKNQTRNSNVSPSKSEKKSENKYDKKQDTKYDQNLYRQLNPEDDPCKPNKNKKNINARICDGDFLSFKKKFGPPDMVYEKTNVTLSDSPQKLTEEKDYQLKRYRFLRNYNYSLNPKLRKKKAKQIQKWWRNQIQPKLRDIDKIKLIQSTYRSYITRKNLKEVILITIFFQNFCDLLRKPIVHYVRRTYFPKRLYKKKYAMEKIFPIKLKQYLKRWKNNSKAMSNRLKACQNLLKIRQNSRDYLLILKAYLELWKLKCEMFNQNMNNNDEISKLVDQHKGLVQLNNALEKYCKNEAFMNCQDELKNYLLEKEREKALLKLLELKKRKEEENLREKFDELRMRTNKNLIDNYKIVKDAHTKNVYPEAIRLIRNYIRRKVLKDLMPAKDYAKLLKKLKRCLDKYEKKETKLDLRNYWNKWVKFIHKYEVDTLKAINLKTVSQFLDILHNKKKLGSQFNNWKFINKLNKHNSINKNEKNAGNLANCVKEIELRRMRQFLDNLKKNKVDQIKSMVIKNLAKNNDKKNLKEYVDRWKNKNNEAKTNMQKSDDYKIKKLKDLFNIKKMKDALSEHNDLQSYFNKWRYTCHLINPAKVTDTMRTTRAALDKLVNALKKNSVADPFNKIKECPVNCNSDPLQKLKKYFIKNDRQNLLRALHKWKDFKNYCDVQALKSKVALTVKQGNLNTRRKVLLEKYFQKLRNQSDNKTRSLNDNLMTLEKKIHDFDKNRMTKAAFDNIKNYSDAIAKQKSAEDSYKLYEKKQKNLLKLYFDKWRDLIRNEKCKKFVNSLDNFLYKKAERDSQFFKNLKNLAMKSTDDQYTLNKRLEKIPPIKSLHYGCHDNRTGNNDPFYMSRDNFNRRNIDNIDNMNNNNMNNNNNNNMNNSMGNSDLRDSCNKFNNPENISNLTTTRYGDDVNNSMHRGSDNPINTLNRQKISNDEMQRPKKEQANQRQNENPENTSSYYERLAPYLNDYLNKLKNKRLGLALKNIKDRSSGNEFGDLVKKYTTKKLIKPKKALLDNLQGNKNKTNALKKMRKFLRHVYLANLKDILKNINHHKNLYYLIRLTMIHKKIAFIRLITKQIRVWRLYVKMANHKTKLLEKMEQNFMNTYENLANNMFGDYGSEPGIQSQIMDFMSKMNYGLDNSTNNTKNSELDNTDDIDNDKDINSNKEDIKTSQNNRDNNNSIRNRYRKINKDKK